MADLSNSKYLGKWRNAYVSFLGKTEPLANEAYIELREDGTASYVSEEETKEYVWKETDYGVFLDGKADLKLKEDDGTLQFKFLGVTITYEKVA